MKRILVPVNFSNSAGTSLRYAASLSRHLGLGLTLLHCYPIHAYNRPYDFGKKDYAAGIRKMLKDFSKEHLGELHDNIGFLAQTGPVSEKIAQISHQYQIIILSGKKFSSNVSRWLGSKSSYIASKAQCPVLIIPSSLVHFPKELTWEKIWHIKRKENETAIIEKALPKLKINPDGVETKSLQQTTFKSAFWKVLVSYVQSPKAEVQPSIIEAREKESIDLFLLVSHGKDSFETFVRNEAFQIIFKFDIPVLIIQAKA